MTKYITLFFSTIIFFVSCETNKIKNIPFSVPEKRNTLKINLKENIITQNPASIGSRSEKFVKYQLYEGLYKVNSYGKTLPMLINEHKLDSLGNIHTFNLKPKVAFHNGQYLETKHIYLRFKEIIDKEPSSSLVQTFRQNIVGYDRYIIRKKYKIGNDSLPSGFKIINNNSFSLESNQTKTNLISTLADPSFWIYTTKDNINYSGTGAYKLEYANEDISYNLIHNDNYHLEKPKGIETINIRFIKNKEAETSEFLNGSLDLIIRSESIDKQLQKSKYEKYNTKRSSYSTLTQLSFRNVKNENIKNLLFQLVKTSRDKRVLIVNTDKNNLTTKNKTDTSTLLGSLFRKIDMTDSSNKIRIPVLIKTEKNSTKIFTQLKLNVAEYFILNEVSYDQLNPIAPYLVIEQSKAHIYTNKVKELAETQRKNVENTSYFSMVLDIKREIIYSNTLLKGLKANSNWELAIQDLYFIKPRILN